MACRLFGANPIAEAMLHGGLLEINIMNMNKKYANFQTRELV